MMQDPKVSEAKQAAADQLLAPGSFSNVLAVGIGMKDYQGTDCVKVYVQSKTALGVDKIPVSFGGVDTDVVEIGRFGRLRQKAQSPKEVGPGFPIRFDTTAPNVNSQAIGTLGATVRYGDQYFILSCNHILAVNGRVPKDTRIVSAVLVGAGAKPEELATFPGDGYFVAIGGYPNPADCALARLDDNRIPPEFTPAALIDPGLVAPGLPVTKTGAITGRTSGMLVDIDADVCVDYSFGTFRFNNQILIDGGQKEDKKDKEFAWDGDSGSIVLSEDGKPIAIVFAEAGRFAVACPLSRVFAQIAELPAFQGQTPTMSMMNLRLP
jgi:hypothetical protein